RGTVHTAAHFRADTGVIPALAAPAQSSHPQCKNAVHAATRGPLAHLQPSRSHRTTRRFMLRTAALAALVAAVGFGATPEYAQETPPPPDTIVVRTPENDARRRFNEGNDLLRQEDYEGALAKFEEGLALDSTNGRNAYGRALALVQLDREDEAVE